MTALSGAPVRDPAPRWFDRPVPRLGDELPMFGEALGKVAAAWTDGFAALTAAPANFAFAGLSECRVAALAGRRGPNPVFALLAAPGWGSAVVDLTRLGQPFEQAGGNEDRARGAGLGLSLVDAFANLHGGRLSLESRLGEGTAATVRMPVLAATQPPPVETVIAELPPAEARSEPLTDGEPPPAPIEAPSDAAPPSIETALPEPEPAVAEAPMQTTEAIVEAPPAPLPPLGPLDGRAVQHHGLRRTVIDLFAHRPTQGLES